MYFFASHYPGINLASGLIYYSSDGWCVGTLPIFGPHCFGDFGLGIMMVEKNHQVWTPIIGYPPGNYPAANFVIYALFRFFLLNFGYAFTIFLWLTVLAICTLAPLWFLTKQYSLSNRIFLMATLGISSVPFLSVLDRGNTVAFLVPCILLAYHGARVKSEKIQILGMVLAITLRPQALLLLCILIFQRKYFAAFRAFLLSLIMNLIVMFAWDYSNFTSNLRYFLNSLVGYGNMSFEDKFPYNYSLAGGIYNILKTLKLGTDMQFLQSLASIIGFCIIAMLLFIVYVKRIEDMKTLYYLTLISMFLLVPVTYIYYTVFILLVIAIALDKSNEVQGIKRTDSIFSRATLLLVGLTLTPFYLPSPASPHYNLIQVTLPLIWLLWILHTVLIFTSNRTRALNLDLN